MARPWQAPTRLAAAWFMLRATAHRVLRACRNLCAQAPVWQGLEVRHASLHGDWPAQADLVALPAHVEHAPRALLRALSHGLPVVASNA